MGKRLPNEGYNNQEVRESQFPQETSGARPQRCALAGSERCDWPARAARSRGEFWRTVSGGRERRQTSATELRLSPGTQRPSGSSKRGRTGRESGHRAVLTICLVSRHSRDFVCLGCPLLPLCNRPLLSIPTLYQHYHLTHARLHKHERHCNITNKRQTEFEHYPPLQTPSRHPFLRRDRGRVINSGTPVSRFSLHQRRTPASKHHPLALTER